jgi:hypothetical protein
MKTKKQTNARKHTWMKMHCKSQGNGAQIVEVKYFKLLCERGKVLWCNISLCNISHKIRRGKKFRGDNDIIEKWNLKHKRRKLGNNDAKKTQKQKL